MEDIEYAEVACPKEDCESCAFADGSPRWIQAKEKYQMMLEYNFKFLDSGKMTGISHSSV